MSLDPLKGPPDQEHALFEQFKQASAGKNVDAVFGAAINILVNAIRQMEPSRKEAEARWDMLFGLGKTLLLDKHYDSVTGKRKTIFPFTQVIRMPMHDADDEVRG